MKLTKRMNDITGQKFNRLTAIRPDHIDKDGNVLWLFKCDCGNKKFIKSCNVRNKNTKSCGCLIKEAMKINRQKINYSPKITNDIEAESPLNEYRLDRGFTWRELEEKSGVKAGHIRPLMLGVVSPIYENHKTKRGMIKSIVFKLMKTLNVSFEDLFPRYACKLNNPKLTDYQIHDLMTGNEIQNPEQKAINKNIWSYGYRCLKCKKNYKHAFFTLRLFSLGYTLEEIGKKINVTRQRIEQIKKAALSVLKNDKYKKALI